MINSQSTEKARNPDVAATIADRLRIFLDEPLPPKSQRESDKTTRYPGLGDAGPPPAIADPKSGQRPK